MTNHNRLIWLSPAEYARLKKCACGHARYEHAKDSLRGDRCYLCGCQGWNPPKKGKTNDA